MAALAKRSIGTDNAADTAQTLKVFVSYSRTDTAFADEIVAGLEYDGGFEVFIDRHSIHEGEEWRERLGGLIAGADVIVFLLSKASATSELCAWEADHAISLSKRIVPAVIEDVGSNDVPPQLQALHYVRFDDDKSFMAGLTALRRALRADLHWIREHTRLLTRAQEWETAGRPANRLLSGADIDAAKAWMADRPTDAPPPLELHHDFISASEHAEDERLLSERARAKELQEAVKRSKRSMMVASGLALVATGTGAFAAYQWNEARIGNVQYEAYVTEAEGTFDEYENAIASLEAENIEYRRALNNDIILDPDTPYVTPDSPSSFDMEVSIATMEKDADTHTALIEKLAASKGLNVSLQPVPTGDDYATRQDYFYALDAYLDYLLQRRLEVENSAPVDMRDYPQQQQRSMPTPQLPDVYRSKK